MNSALEKAITKRMLMIYILSVHKRISNLAQTISTRQHFNWEKAAFLGDLYGLDKGNSIFRKVTFVKFISYRVFNKRNSQEQGSNIVPGNEAVPGFTKHSHRIHWAHDDPQWNLMFGKPLNSVSARAPTYFIVVRQCCNEIGRSSFRSSHFANKLISNKKLQNDMIKES